MKKAVVVLIATVALTLSAAGPVFAAPASGGLGRMFGEHISTEAKAGTLGPDIHPGQHFGFHGWMM